MWLQSYFRKGWLVLFIAGSIIAMQGCLNTDEPSGYDPYEFLNKDIESIQAYLEDNNIDAEMDSSTGIFVQYHSKGDGYRTLNGVEIEADYQGLTFDGVEFANTFSGIPERITLGRDVNPDNYTLGLNIGLTKMNEGDSATIYVPSPYGFQNSGYNNVPPNTILVYNVKFKDILLLSEDLEDIDQYIADKTWTATTDSIYGLRYVLHSQGDQDVPIELKDYVRLDYTGQLLNDTEFDSGELQIYLGQDGYRLIIGFEIALTNLHQNDSATIFIPSIYGYGENGSGGVIPPNAPLLFGVDIVNVTKPF